LKSAQSLAATLPVTLIAAPFALTILASLLLLSLAASLLLAALRTRTFLLAALSTLATFGASLLTFLIALLAPMISVVCHNECFKLKQRRKKCHKNKAGPCTTLSMKCVNN
jgi:hypothetical protein